MTNDEFGTRHRPTEIRLKREEKTLEIDFEDGKSFRLPAELLRVESPSAEVQGHGSGESVLVFDKEDVNIDRIEPIGRYAVRLVFDDGHDTGLYTWPILYKLGVGYEANWQRYLERLNKAGHQRSAETDGRKPEKF